MDMLGAHLPLAKIAYSAVLVAVIWFFVQELQRIWLDDQTYVTVASYFADGKVDTARAVAFGGHVPAMTKTLRPRSQRRCSGRPWARNSSRSGRSRATSSWPGCWPGNATGKSAT